MLRNDPDRDWEKFGSSDPYWAVLVEDRYHSASLTPQNMAEFFASGERDVASVFSTVERHLAPDFNPNRALDFGCGVGRLVIPMAPRCGEVIGVDVSEAMLAEARRNAAGQGITNASFVKADDALSAVQGPLDFVHSYIVFQHIPVPRGERITRRLIELLRPGGIGALHYTFEAGLSPKSAALLWARTRVPFANAALNLVLGRKPSHPVMQVNSYSVNRLLGILQTAGCERVHALLTDHQGSRGAMLVFQKPALRP